jgi:hypothetical protein
LCSTTTAPRLIRADRPKAASKRPPGAIRAALVRDAINFDQATGNPQGFPCPGSLAFGCNPNFVNVDLTGTKRFGKWELGPVGFYSTDISTPFFGYLRQSKAAIGGLVGYWFDPVILQVYVTTELYEKNYRGKDTRLWSRLVIPFGNQPTRPIGY